MCLMSGCNGVEFRSGLASGGKEVGAEPSFFSTTHDYNLRAIGQVMFCWVQCTKDFERVEASGEA